MSPRRPERGLGPPRRFRRRLTIAFVLVAAVSSGVLALLTLGLAHRYRWRNFDDKSRQEAQVALAFTPAKLSDSSFERLVDGYVRRIEAEVVAQSPDRVFSSSSAFTIGDVPSRLRAETDGDAVRTATADAGGRRWYVVTGQGTGGNRYYFFFSLQQLETSLHELQGVTLVAWLLTVLIAAAVGEIVSRQTLRPVRSASQAARALASGLLDTRLPLPEPTSDEADDEFVAWAGSFNDMAEALQRTIEELRAAAERERQFTSDIAHDLRTPLTSMSASANLLAEHLADLPESAAWPAGVLVADVARFSQLVTELLELAQLDAHAEPVEPEALSVAEAIAATQRSLRSPAPLSVKVVADPALVVWAERRRLRRVLGNLLLNAAVHGGGEVEVRAYEDGAEVVVEVCDDGPGIPPADVAHVFDRFYKTDASRASGGSGLGLAIAFEHARAQRGSLTATNRPGRGACFTLRLPAPPAHAALVEAAPD